MIRSAFSWITWYLLSTFFNHIGILFDITVPFCTASMIFLSHAAFARTDFISDSLWERIWISSMISFESSFRNTVLAEISWTSIPLFTMNLIVSSAQLERRLMRSSDITMSASPSPYLRFCTSCKNIPSCDSDDILEFLNALTPLSWMNSLSFSNNPAFLSKYPSSAERWSSRPPPPSICWMLDTRS